MKIVKTEPKKVARESGGSKRVALLSLKCYFGYFKVSLAHAVTLKGLLLEYTARGCGLAHANEKKSTLKFYTVRV